MSKPQSAPDAETPVILPTDQNTTGRSLGKEEIALLTERDSERNLIQCKRHHG